MLGKSSRFLWELVRKTEEEHLEAQRTSGWWSSDGDGFSGSPPRSNFSQSGGKSAALAAALHNKSLQTF